MTTLCLQLDGNYKTPIIFFYSENNSDSLNRPPNTNLINVRWVVRHIVMSVRVLRSATHLPQIMPSKIRLTFNQGFGNMR